MQGKQRLPGNVKTFQHACQHTLPRVSTRMETLVKPSEKFCVFSLSSFIFSLLCHSLLFCYIFILCYPVIFLFFVILLYFYSLLSVLVYVKCVMKCSSLLMTFDFLCRRKGCHLTRWINQHAYGSLCKGDSGWKV